MIMLVKSLAIDYGPLGVRANAVCPAWIRTAMADGSMDELAELRGSTREEAYAYANRLVPARRAGSVAEAAATVVWLTTEEAGYINGVALPVDGGAGVVDVGMVWEDA
jgi:NAD(P)-dependent dehydrogenase (short-subunit alcohol dehydrogenase family)